MDQEPILEDSVLMEFIATALAISEKISPQVNDYFKEFSKLLTKSSDQISSSGPFLFLKWIYPIQNPTSSPICSKSFATSANKKVFRCFDCMELDTALLCYDCFVKSNHKGHTYREFQAEGGCCDCGDSQLWNENGFCPTHSNKNQKINLPAHIKQLFVKEMTFVYYLYFWTVDKQKIISSIRKEYGSTLFDYINKLIESNFESKLLIAELMNSSFEGYPSLSTTRSTIIESIFHLNRNFDELNKLQKFAFEMYPVESFRETIVIQYFRLTATNTFIWNHPIRKFNFQYMTCVKKVNRLISENRLLPLHLTVCDSFENTEELIEIFKKYYEDLNYLRKLKESKQYFVFHFEMISSVQMAFYRRFSSIQKDQQIFLDEFYLKSLGASLHYILERKDLVVKHMIELFNYIVNVKQMTFSLAQQRAFGMFMMVFLEGSLENMLQEYLKDEILSILNIEKSSAAHIFGLMIRQGLKNIAKLSQFSIKPLKNSYESFFFNLFPQRCFLENLDLIYHKVLMILSKGLVNYWEVVQEVFFQLIEHKEMEQISCLSLFLAKIFSNQLNEISISNNIGFPNQEKITSLYLKLISTYGHKFGIKQIKTLASYFINNPDRFLSVLKELCVFEKSKINLVTPVEPLDKFMYMDMLKDYKYYQEVNWVAKEKIIPVKCLRNFEIQNEELINYQVQNGLKLIERLKEQPGQTVAYKLLVSNLEKQVVALLQVYLLTYRSIIKQFFANSLEQLKIYLNIEIINHLNQLCKEKTELIDEFEKNKQDKQEEYKRKRERIDTKRREKELTMKKNQEMMLKQYNVIEEQQSHENENCIYCKEEIKDDYHLLSYINITNLISKCYIKENNNIHFFITTCGHKVHEQCYTKSSTENQLLRKCYLCKRKTNISIPNISKESLAETERESIATSFLDSIYATLITEYEEKWDIFQQFYQKQHKANILATVVTSLVREAIYYGLNDFEQFKKYSLIAYQLTFKLLELVNKEQLRDSFAIIKANIVESKNQLVLMEAYAYQLLQKMLLIKDIETQVELQPLLISELQKILSLITQNNEQKVQISNTLTIRRDGMLLALPENINELHSLMGQCPICGKLTNWIYYCLLCNMKACNKETNAFHKHSQEDHVDGSIFISAGNGKASIICGGRAKNEESLYENQHGQMYSHTDENSKKSYLLSFHLNHERYESLFKKLICHHLQNLVSK